MVKLNYTERKIGNLIIHQEQHRAADDILKVFQSLGVPLLIAQPQQGKTECCVAVIDQFINHCETTGKSFEVVYVINISNDALKDQTEHRIWQSGLSPKVRTLHHGNLKSFEPDQTKHLRLVVIDECHISQTESDDNSKKPFHEFLKKCGVSYADPMDKWSNKNNLVLSVSATPYGHAARMNEESKAFTPVVLEVDPTYYSLQHLKADNRLYKSFPLVQKGIATRFLIERLDDFTSMKNKYLLLRAKGTHVAIIEKYIQQNYKNFDVIVFGDDEKNLHRLNKTVSTEPPRSTVIIVKGSLRAGQTLDTTKHIGMCIQSHKSKTDTVIQELLGRMLGREMEGGKNRRFEDTFLIYCDLREFDQAIEFYNGFKCIPTGIQNKKSFRVDKEYEYVLLDHYPTQGEVIDLMEEIGSDVPWDNLKKINRLNSISERNDEACIELLDKTAVRGTDGWCATFYFDKPHKNRIDEWTQVVKRQPKWIGNYLLCIPKPLSISNSYSGKIKSTSILNGST